MEFISIDSLVEMGVDGIEEYLRKTQEALGDREIHPDLLEMAFEALAKLGLTDDELDEFVKRI